MIFDSTESKSTPFAPKDRDSVSSVPPGLQLAQPRMLCKLLPEHTVLFAALGHRVHGPLLIVPVLQVQPHGH